MNMSDQPEHSIEVFVDGLVFEDRLHLPRSKLSHSPFHVNLLLSMLFPAPLFSTKFVKINGIEN